MPGITVGVDGSGHSENALSWAMQEAAIRHAPLNVIAVHEVAVSWTTHPIVLPADEPLMDKERSAVEELIAKVTSQAGSARPASVNVQVVPGIPANVLVDASKDSDLLVVGARGSGGFAELLLGSISHKVVQHAACPVVVVPTRAS